MLSRLKTFPLTIVLTILIWMYAEAQFASKHATITETEALHDLPVWVSGPPEVVERYKIELHPPFLKSLTVSGSPAVIQSLRQRMASGTNSTASKVHAYLDITADDQPSEGRVTRSLRYTLPPGLTLLKYPGEVDFRLVEK
ncbi:MAG: hypothetical protein FWD53_07265 [Phycisphaerales bacterium]|nr:hypothetical protein [Phycisphaerales bacterium]